MPGAGATDEIETELGVVGYSIRSGAALQAWLGAPWQDWRSFAASWNDLGEDQHMADGGRYRRRRYAVFDVAKGTISRAPHQPHYQSTIYNRLNGGLERWFEPASPEVGQHPITRTLIRRLAVVFDKNRPPRERFPRVVARRIAPVSESRRGPDHRAIPLRRVFTGMALTALL